MSTQHTYFRSGRYNLLAHVDCKQGGTHSQGVVFVPPFGWEDVCSYRPLRWLAKRLANQGTPILRFDLPGTGDSSGDARDPDLVQAWIESINHAAETLRAISGAGRISVLGVRLGALLALSAATRNQTSDNLILWAPSTGRSVVREWKAFRNLEAIEYAGAEAAPAVAVPGLGVAGFLISPETQEAIENLDFSTLPYLGTRRILLLSRDGLPHDPKLLRAIQASQAEVELRTGSGFASMTALPEEVIPPRETSELIIDFLRKNAINQSSDRGCLPVSRHSAVSSGERTWEHNGCFGILSDTFRAPQPECAAVFLNAGAVRHIGPNRLWVEAARRLAERGVPSLRLDLPGIGESEGEQNLNMPKLYQHGLIEQAEECIKAFQAELGARYLFLVGLCAGALWAFHLALRHTGVRGAVLINPRLFHWDPEIDKRRALRRAAGGLTNPAMWKRLAEGDVSPDKFRRVAAAALSRIGRRRRGVRHAHQQVEVSSAWHRLGQKDARISLVFTEGEPLLQEMEEEGRMPPAFVRLTRVRDTGHTFRPLWAQEQLHQILDRETDWIRTGMLRELAHAAHPNAPETIRSVPNRLSGRSDLR